MEDLSVEADFPSYFEELRTTLTEVLTKTEMVFWNIFSYRKPSSVLKAQLFLVSVAYDVKLNQTLQISKRILLQYRLVLIFRSIFFVSSTFTCLPAVFKAN